MQGEQQINPSARKKDDDEDDRAGFFFFPFFQGQRVEMIPPLLIFAAVLWLALWYPAPPAEEPVQPQQTAAAPAAAAPEPAPAPAPEPAPAPVAPAEPPAPAPATETAAATPAPEPVAPEPVKVETQRWGSSIIFPIEGKDSAGRGATFDVAVLTKELSWVSRSWTQLAMNGDPIPDDQLNDRLFTPELRDGLSQSKQVMAIGLASQEGQVEEETERAANRAKTAAGWLANAVAAETPIWVLNLGQFKKNGCPAQTETTDTSWQRPVILAGVKSQDEGVDLVEAFANAISGKSNLPSRECYTSFDLTRFR